MKTRERISRNDLNLDIALLISRRSTCNRGQVGAVITTMAGRIISTGYNGPMKHEQHCSDVCDLTKSCTRAVHAEANAIYNAARIGISLLGTTLYCTHRPCRKCFEAIAAAGITQVFYLNDYDTDNKSWYDIQTMFMDAGIRIAKIDDFKSRVTDEEQI